MQGKFTLKQLGNYLGSHPDECQDFLVKVRGGLAQITNPTLRKLFEENEVDLLYDFNSDVMKVGIPPE